MLLISLVSADRASATQVYKWVDEDGQAHYSQTKPAGVDAEQKRVRVRSAPKHAPTEPEPTVESEEIEGDPHSFILGGKVYCRTIKCIKERMEAGEEFNCMDRRCHEAAAQLRYNKEQDERNRKFFANGDQAEDSKLYKRLYSKKERENYNKSYSKKYIETLLAECVRAHDTYCRRGIPYIEMKRRELSDRIRRYVH